MGLQGATCRAGGGIKPECMHTPQLSCLHLSGLHNCALSEVLKRMYVYTCKALAFSVIDMHSSLIQCYMMRLFDVRHARMCVVI